jgi:hypothetical protein
LPQRERLLELRKNAISQLLSLRKSPYTLDKIKSPFKKESQPPIKNAITNGNSVSDDAMSKALKKK